MAVSVIGGLLTSLFLTLIVVPVAYDLFADMTDYFKGKKKPEIGFADFFPQQHNPQPGRAWPFPVQENSNQNQPHKMASTVCHITTLWSKRWGCLYFLVTCG